MPSKSSSKKTRPKRSPVITRLAPSPTGPFHIGNARTALFNFLYAHSQGGRFLLRIEDTDQERSEGRFAKEITAGLEWLDLTWDGEPLRQSQRLGAYREALESLKSGGWAYEQAGAWYFSVKRATETRTEITFADLIRGEITTALQTIEDFVLVRSDGSPLFLFAGVVDDAGQGVTDVIRGEDHISNTPRQILIAEALELPVPQYAHLPLILAPDRTKLSKRHGAVELLEYRRMGFLPEALVNYLALLGWHPKEEREHFTLKELIKKFSLDRVQKGGAIFDQTKLEALNSYYIRTLPAERVIETLLPLTAHTADEEKLKLGFQLVRDRLRRLSEFDSLTLYLWQPPSVDTKILVFKKSTTSATLKGLSLVISKLEISNSTVWSDPGKLKHCLEAVVEEGDLTNGDVFWPVRVALTGREASPPPEELLEALGREESIERLRKALNLFQVEQKG